MKISFLCFLLVAMVAIVAFPAASRAQVPVSTGIIESVRPQLGEVTIRSDQKGQAITFYGLQKANIFHVDGTPAVMSDLAPGHHVTMEYAERQGRWYVSKVLLNQKQPMPAGFVPDVESHVMPLTRSAP